MESEAGKDKVSRSRAAKDVVAGDGEEKFETRKTLEHSQKERRDSQSYLIDCGRTSAFVGFLYRIAFSIRQKVFSYLLSFFLNDHVNAGMNKYKVMKH